MCASAGHIAPCLMGVLEALAGPLQLVSKCSTCYAQVCASTSGFTPQTSRLCGLFSCSSNDDCHSQGACNVTSGICTCAAGYSGALLQDGSCCDHMAGATHIFPASTCCQRSRQMHALCAELCTSCLQAKAARSLRGHALVSSRRPASSPRAARLVH